MDLNEVTYWKHLSPCLKCSMCSIYFSCFHYYPSLWVVVEPSRGGRWDGAQRHSLIKGFFNMPPAFCPLVLLREHQFWHMTSVPSEQCRARRTWDDSRSACLRLMDGKPMKRWEWLKHPTTTCWESSWGSWGSHGCPSGHLIPRQIRIASLSRLLWRPCFQGSLSSWAWPVAVVRSSFRVLLLFRKQLSQFSQLYLHSLSRLQSQGVAASKTFYQWPLSQGEADRY